VRSVFWLLAIMPSVTSAAAVHEVPRGGSIAAVLERAESGDLVYLAGGIYQENIVVNVPVVLTGAPGSEIRGGYEGNVVHITAPGTVLEGLHIAEAGPRLTKDMACVLVEADTVTIRNCTITESLHGIYVKAGNGTEITGNRIEGRLDLIEADRGNGIHLWNSSQNRIIENEILNARDGIYFSFANFTEVERNHIHQVRYGLHYMYSNNNSFYDNLFENNVAGAALMYSEDIIFSRNTFARCRGFRAYGILLQSMSRVLATSNLIIDNSRGIFMNNADTNVVEHNDVINNDLAVQLNGGCDGNLIVRNNFINNLSELLLDVSDVETRWADGDGGNHWSGYRGYDLDGNGAGDFPFPIQNVFQVLETKVPEARFYLLSPAAEVLKAAEHALPILRLGDAEDPLPSLLPVTNLEVPWDAVSSGGSDGSAVAASLFLAGSAFPVACLWLLGRPRRRDSNRGSGRSR
jgi:nitrous oxidase accessory protein